MSAPTLPPASPPPSAPPTRSAGWGELAARPLSRSRGWRVALRMASRDLRRNPGRTAAAAVMVVVPVVLGGMAAVLVPTADVTYEERLEGHLGAAEGVLAGPEALPYPEAAGPAAATTEVVRSAAGPGAVQVGRTLPLVVEGAELTVSGALVVPFEEPLTAGLVDVVRGRLPSGPGEVALSPGLARTVDVDVGGTVTVAGGTLDVVGLAVQRSTPAADHDLVVAPGTLEAPLLPERSWWLLPRPERLGAVPAGYQVVWRDQVGSARLSAPLVDLNGDAVLLFSLVAGLVVLQIALLAGPAFAVGARQQQRALAVLRTTGADGRALRQVVLAQAVLVGGLGSLAGAAAGVALAVLGVDVVRHRVPVLLGPTGVSVWLLLAVVGVGTAAAVAAALVPAVQAGRRAEAGGRPVTRVRPPLPWARPLLGAGLVAAASTYLLGTDGAETLGPVAAVLVAGIGMVLLGTLPVALLGRLPHRAPTSLRLAARESARAGTRTVAAVGAVGGASAALVATLCVSTAWTAVESARYSAELRPGVAEVGGTVDDGLLDTVRRAGGPDIGLTGGLWSQTATADAHAEVVLATEGCPEPFRDEVTLPCAYDAVGGGWVVVVDATAAGFRTWGLSQVELDHLAAGGVLVGTGVPVRADGTVELVAQVNVQARTADAAPRTEVRRTVVPARTVDLDEGPALVVPPPVAESVGAWFPRAVEVELAPGLDPTDEGAVVAAEAAARALQQAVRPSGAYVYLERGYRDRAGLVEVAVALVAVLLVLVATFTATALALADGRRDASVLAALGASPRLRRRVAGWTAALVAAAGAAVGSLAGGALGLVSAWRLVDEVVWSRRGEVAPRLGLLDAVPWWALGGLLVALPLLAGLLVALVARGGSGPDARRLGAGAA